MLTLNLLPLENFYTYVDNSISKKFEEKLGAAITSSSQSVHLLARTCCKFEPGLCHQWQFVAFLQILSDLLGAFLFFKG